MRGMRWALAALLLACPPKPPAPPTPPVEPAAECPAAAHPTGEQACDGFFTEAGTACFRCPDQEGCVDRDLRIYCTRGPCAMDPACHLEPRYRGEPE